MQEKKTLVIGDYTAEVLEEKKFAYFTMNGGGKSPEMIEPLDENLTKAYIDGLRQQALQKGFDTIMIVHDRYVQYSLRHVMRNRSGWYTKTTKHTFTVDGVWTKVTKIQNKTY